MLAWTYAPSQRKNRLWEQGITGAPVLLWKDTVTDSLELNKDKEHRRALIASGATRKQTGLVQTVNAGLVKEEHKQTGW